MRMVRWMCNVKVKDRVPSKELILQQTRLQWYGHLLRKEDTDWVKKCMEYEMRAPDQEVDQRGHEKGCAKKIAKHVI